MRLQNDIQQGIVAYVKHASPTMDMIMDHMMVYYIHTVSSTTVRGWIRANIQAEIQKLIEWSVICEVEDDGEPMGYYQTDWTSDQMNLPSLYSPNR